MKRGLKRLFLFLLIVFAIIVAGLAYFFYSSEAPITNGEVLHHIEYKDGLTLDLYQPTQKVYKQSPLVIFFHGGAWVGGSKEVININRYHISIKQLRDEGYAVISANYTLASKEESPFPASIDDAYDVMVWVKKNANNYAFDLNNIGVFGESAGAHIALMLSYSRSDSVAAFFGIPKPIKYVVDVYGPTQLDSLYHMQMVDSLNAIIERVPERIRDCINITQHLFGFNPQEDSLRTNAFTKEFSPITYVSSHCPPTLIIHGIEDRIVPIQQSRMLLLKLEEQGVLNEYNEIEHMDHAFRGANTEQREWVQNKIYQFIIEQYEEL